MQGRVENMWQKYEMHWDDKVDLGIVILRYQIRSRKYQRFRSPPRIPAGDLRGPALKIGPVVLKVEKAPRREASINSNTVFQLHKTTMLSLEDLEEDFEPSYLRVCSSDPRIIIEKAYFHSLADLC
jgi:hypothetical protein